MRNVCETGAAPDACESDSETGLYYYRARYYDQTLGRFLSEDPIGFNAKRFNFYPYASDNPVRFVDPFGLCPQFDSVTNYHLDCQKLPTVKDKCACHAVYVPDGEWQDFMDKCTVCTKKDAKPRDTCLCQCNLIKKFMPERMNKTCEAFCNKANPI
jgi:RHS repeat-associated protein